MWGWIQVSAIDHNHFYLILVNLILFSELFLHRLFRNIWIHGGGQSIRVITLNIRVYIRGTHKAHNVLTEAAGVFFFL